MFRRITLPSLMDDRERLEEAKEELCNLFEMMVAFKETMLDTEYVDILKNRVHISMYIWLEWINRIDKLLDFQ